MWLLQPVPGNVRIKDKSAQQAMMDLFVFQNRGSIKRGNNNPFDHGERHTEEWKTGGSKIGSRSSYNFDAVFGGARSR